MPLWSDRRANGEPIPARFAAGQPAADGATDFSDNLSPHLAWSEVPADLARVDLMHGVLVDLPTTLTQFDEGGFSRGFTPQRKPGPAVEVTGARPARRGLNDFSGGFSGNVDMAGDCFGHDGPYPPFNDSRVHHDVFTAYALRVAGAPVEGRFSGVPAREAIYPHIRAEASHSASCTLNRRLR